MIYVHQEQVREFGIFAFQQPMVQRSLLDTGIRFAKDIAIIQVDTLGDSPTAMTDIHNIIKHIGSGINILKLSYCLDDYEDTPMDDFSHSLIGCILSECSDLQTLSLKSVEHIDIDEIKPSHDHLCTLKITSVDES